MGRRRRAFGLLCHRSMHSRRYRSQHRNLYRLQTKRHIGRNRRNFRGNIPLACDYYRNRGILQNFLEYRYVTYAFNGIRVCVCVLIFDAVTNLLKKAVIDIPTAIVFAAVFLLSMFTSLPVAVLVVLSGIVGVCVKSVKKHTDKGGQE